MSNTPLLTVTIVVQNQKDVTETTLTSLYELSDIPLELFVIDDGSTDGSDEVIQSVIDYYQHEQTFYYEHDAPVGRGYSLNEALLQSAGTLFWAPETIREINEDKLRHSIEYLSGSAYTGLLQRTGLPTDATDWFDLWETDQWPGDDLFLWKTATITAGQRYFSPFLNRYCSLELAARLADGSFEQENDSWSRPNPVSATQTPGPATRQELLFSLLRRTDTSGAHRDTILEALHALDTGDRPLTERDFDLERLNEATAMIEDGRFNLALEAVEQVLAEHPEHRAAQQLKIKILEKKQRFVEASELKHQFNKSVSKKPRRREKSAPTPDTGPAEETEARPPQTDPEISLIIPTAIYGKAALEHCLLSVSEHCNTADIRLIVIDNASLDDTHDYLEELREKQFLQCQVITNRQNVGFAASVNQGLEKADTPYACIMHNDVECTDDALAQLKEALENHSEYAVAGPATDKTLNPDQALGNIDVSGYGLIETEYIDSFCMMVRTDAGLQMDEAYELAFFEDIDFCFQAQSAGHKIGIVPHAEVKHHLGTTTFPLDLDTESKQYWKNVAYFNDKWQIEKFSEEELKALGTFDQLLVLDELVNPLYPEEEIEREFERLFTDEMKTEIFNTDHDAETLCRLTHLFMVMNKRDVMRRLEDRLEGVELPATLIYQLVRFYYNLNIYSRCTHYLDQLKAPNESLRADLYRLAILVENKDFSEAVPLLRHLLDHAPANPTLYKLAGDIHKFNGNDEESRSFHELAKQINPFKFDQDPTDAFGFEL